MNIPGILMYTKDLVWVRIEGEMAVIGITDYAQNQLGDIVFIDIQTVGESLEKEEVFGAIEAVKTVADAFMPLSGTVEAMNEALESAPEMVNQDPYGEGWMIRIKISDPDQIGGLLTPEAYAQLIA